MKGPRSAPWDRSEALDRLARERFDVLVVGGGVVGAGVARDAALRGLATAIVEAGDWASGTSSRTTKFAHGGLRYLEHLDLDLVRTALAERGVLLAIAPHLTHATPFLLPAYAGRSRTPWKVRAGLSLYDLLAGRARLGRHRFLDREDAVRREPVLAREGLEGAAVYWDARVRDARLVVETVADARRAGAVAANRCAARDLEPWGGGWVVELEDRTGGGRIAVRARTVVNAAGPWADRIRSRAAPGADPILGPTKGVHVVVPHAVLPLRDPVALFAADGRLVFAVPEGAWTYVGTTDTEDGGDPDDVSVADSDVEYLVDAVDRSTKATVRVADVVGAWAGWRPLLRGEDDDPDAIPRDEVIESTAPGLVTVTGGKLTTYRAMAEEATDRIVEEAGFDTPPCVTARRPLVPPSVGGEGPPPSIPPAAVARVRERFGPDSDDVFAGWRDDPASAEPLGEAFPTTAAEVRRAAIEMVDTLEDLLDRRLSALPGGEPVSDDAAAAVADAAADILGWDTGRRAREVEAYLARRRFGSLESA